MGRERVKSARSRVVAGRRWHPVRNGRGGMGMHRAAGERGRRAGCLILTIVASPGVATHDRIERVEWTVPRDPHRLTLVFWDRGRRRADPEPIRAGARDTNIRGKLTSGALGREANARDRPPQPALGGTGGGSSRRFELDTLHVHLIDATWPKPAPIRYETREWRNGDPDSLDRFDHFVACLERQGICVNLNLLIGWKFVLNDGSNRASAD